MRFARMRVLSGWLFAVGVLLADSPPARAELTFDWATVGDAGNAGDTLVMTKCPSSGCMGDGTSGYGGVAYAYQIATRHVTNRQYAEFLNEVDPNGANTLRLFDSRMETFFHPVSFLPTAAFSGGIDFENAASAGSKYQAKSGAEDFPATWVSWVSAARLVNWLSNGQGSGDTEAGVYNGLPTTTSSPVPAREAGATIFLPTENEFYKAAYYNPTLGGGAGGYTQYGSGNQPPVVQGPVGSAASANYAQTDGVDGPNGDTYWQSGGASFDDSLVYLTDTGAYTQATSYYGLFDVDGNAYQWLESTRPNRFNTAQDLPLFRGGAWFHGADGSGAAYRNTQFFAAGSSSLSTNYHGVRLARLIPVDILTGDYNSDGAIDAADYTVWRDNLGGSASALNGNGSGDASGLVVQADYDLWKNLYGGGSAVGDGVSVPEPSMLVMTLIVMTVIRLENRPRMGDSKPTNVRSRKHG